MGERAADLRDGHLHGCRAVVLPEADGTGRSAYGRACSDDPRLSSRAATRSCATGARATIRTISMFNTNLDAIVPMLCVTLAALASLAMEAFRGRGERSPIGGLGIIGLAGAAASSMVLWNRNADGFGVIVAD